MLQRQKRWLAEYLRALIYIIPIAFLLRSCGYGLYRVPSSSMEPTMLVGERFFADKFTIHFWPPRRGEIISFNDPRFNYSKNRLISLWQRYAWGPNNFTKRVIGIPGDHVQGVIERGKPVIYLNENKLDEPYVNTLPLIAISADPEVWRSYDPFVPFEKQPLYRMKQEQIFHIQKLLERRGKTNIRHPQIALANGTDVFNVVLDSHQYWVMGDNRLASSDSRQWGSLSEQFIHGRILWRLWSIDSVHTWWIFDLLLHPLDFWSQNRWQRAFKKV